MDAPDKLGDPDAGCREAELREVGRPYVFSNVCFAAAFLFRNATGIRYRQLQGVAEAVVGRENAPTYSAFQKRMTKLGCTFTDKGKNGTASVWFSDGGTKAEIKLFSFDSTGLKPTNRGDWMTENGARDADS